MENKEKLEIKEKTEVVNGIKMFTCITWFVIPFMLFMPWSYPSGNNGGAVVWVSMLGFLVFVIFQLF
ncbi:hypothetical protein [Marinicella rhabdoformis]|uniref:hypothetical protein n=1 Tax=Marinicella rhabdoformis TaxID=2580566 RepID=UPI0012AEDCED|nr:hypothetical protein [Marinicella rhabdoformis]